MESVETYGQKTENYSGTAQTTYKIDGKRVSASEAMKYANDILSQSSASTTSIVNPTSSNNTSSNGEKSPNGNDPKDPKPWYGNFVGPGPDKNPYHLKDQNGKTLKPIDMIDAAAQKHDYAYFKANTGGIHGALFNKTVANADIALAHEAEWVIFRYTIGLEDDITGQPITPKEFSAAIIITDLFSSLGNLKKL